MKNGYRGLETTREENKNLLKSLVVDIVEYSHVPTARAIMNPCQ